MEAPIPTRLAQGRLDPESGAITEPGHAIRAVAKHVAPVTCDTGDGLDAICVQPRWQHARRGVTRRDCRWS